MIDNNINFMINNKIEKLYAAFSNEAKPLSIEACECCIGDEELTNLIKTPLRQLKPEQLSNYASSVFLTAGSEKDFRYLIPRILDISIHNQFNWPDHEVICSSLARGHWLSWPDSLQASIIDLFFAALERAVQNDNGYEVDELICGFALTGIDIYPFLERLEEKNAEKTLIGLYERNSKSLMKGKLSNPFWREHEVEANAVIEWFSSTKIVEIINCHYGMIQ